MDLRKIQSLPAEPDVPVQKGKVTADSLNQIIINGLRHLILCQRMGPAGGVIPYSGIKNRLFHLSAVNGSHRVPVLAVYAVEAAEGIFPHSPVPAFHESDKIAVGDGNGISVLILYCRELNICIIEHIEYSGSSLGCFCRCSQKFFFLRIQRVGFLCQKLFKGTLKMPNPIFRIHKFLQLSFRNFQDLRYQEGRLSGGLIGQGLRPPEHLLIFLVSRVLIRPHSGVNVEKFHLFRHLFIENKAPVQIVCRPAGTSS